MVRTLSRCQTILGKAIASQAQRASTMLKTFSESQGRQCRHVLTLRIRSRLSRAFCSRKSAIGTMLRAQSPVPPSLKPVRAIYQTLSTLSLSQMMYASNHLNIVHAKITMRGLRTPKMVIRVIHPSAAQLPPAISREKPRCLSAKYSRKWVPVTSRVSKMVLTSVFLLSKRCSFNYCMQSRVTVTMAVLVYQTA